MSTSDARDILGAIHALRRDLRDEVKQLREDLTAEADRRDERLHGEMREVKGELREVKTEAKVTNGNVRSLQLWRAKLEGARWALGRVPILIASLAGLAAVASLAVTVAVAAHG